MGGSRSTSPRRSRNPLDPVDGPVSPIEAHRVAFERANPRLYEYIALVVRAQVLEDSGDRLGRVVEDPEKVAANWLWNKARAARRKVRAARRPPMLPGAAPVVEEWNVPMFEVDTNPHP